MFLKKNKELTVINLYMNVHTYIICIYNSGLNQVNGSIVKNIILEKAKNERWLHIC